MDDSALKSEADELSARLQKKIDETFENPSSPPPLYHYTSAEGMAGILQHKKIWATHYLYVNDATEYIYANLLIGEVIEEKLPDASPMVRAIFESIQKTPGGLLGLTEPYIACFCEKGDLLS